MRLPGGTDDRVTYRQLPHTPALDGLRALAIAAVILFHFPTRTVFAGGLFGVDLFFALSGFLVTALLLAELSSQGGVHLRGFLARRGWRLVPALVTFLLLYLAVDAAFGRSKWFASNPFGNRSGGPIPFHLATKGVVAAATYSLNEMRAHHVPLPPITNLWSLSVEGQFYLVWPIVIVILLRKAPRALLPVTALCAAVSASLPWLLWHGGAGADQIYFGSTTRVQGLLIGSLGAQIWSRGWFAPVPVAVRRALAGASALTLGWMFVTVGDEPFKYLGGLVVASTAGILLVMHFAEPAPEGWFGWVLGRAPLQWLGQRSYAIYLWQYVFDSWTNPLPHIFGVPFGIGLSLVAAEVSWRLVEVPAQRLARRRRAARPVTTPAPPPARVLATAGR